jgi:hypothetical protein
MIENSRTCPLILSFILTTSTCLFPPAAFSKDGIPVNIHGVNYTAEPFQYVISDPEAPANTAGGEHVEPFSAGGIMCCYDLPRQWKPGMKARVDVTYWTKDSNNRNLRENKHSQLVDIPRYEYAKAEELWILRTKDGRVELVSSDLQPDHRNWPGKTKGWPMPSIAYQQERWELYRKIAENSVLSAKQLLSEIESDPENAAHESWEFDKKHSRDVDLTKFSGPDDPAYFANLKQRYEEWLSHAQKKLEMILSRKP